MRSLAGRASAAFVGSFGLLAALPAAAETPIGRQDLCVTKGEIGAAPGGRLTIEEPEVRAVSRVPTPQAAEIRFTYRGPSRGTKPLGSGEIRRQLGIKLRAPVIDHFDGPVGLRTDNVRVEMQYAALDGRPDPGARLAARMQAACGGQSEGD